MSEFPKPDFRKQYGPWALIAGASDGIGECYARECAQRGLHVVLLARRAARLAELAAELEQRHGVKARTLVADLGAGDLEQRVLEGTRELEIGLLIYNAGAVHGAAKFVERPLSDALALVNLNCRGPVLLAHHFGGAMRRRGRGGIVLMGSIAGLCGSSYTTVYAASKSFDMLLAEGLWHELAPAGVHVLGAIAGATRTPSMLASNPAFENYPNLMQPADVARGALDALGSGPLWVAGEANRATAAAMLPVPRVALINGMSEATASLYALSHTPVAGADFAQT